jgi:chitin disaccharide deacetylase
MNRKDDEIILITRADDMGYTHSGNLGTLSCLRGGFIRSAAILVIAPWFEEAAEMAGNNPDQCFGVHMGIIGEWRGYRWRPVLPYSDVPSLVDEDGFLWRSPAELWANNPSMDELEKEFTAQVTLAQKKGVNVEYLDTHYIMPYDSRIRPVVERIGKKFGLPISCLLGENELPDFGIYSAPPQEKEAALVRVLKELKPGTNLLIAHPGFPSVENDALIHSEPKDVQAVGVGRNRAAETAAYTSPRIKQVVEELGIQVLSYREFCASRQ